MNTGCLTRLHHARSIRVGFLAAGLVIALPMTAGIALAQDPAANTNTFSTKFSIPDGYSAKHTVDVGGRVANKVGSGAMYDTMVNEQSGPRVSGETLDLHKLASNKHALVDHARLTGSGFGGDPYNFAKLTAEKSKIYAFTGTFRRNRQYFDYNLLGNPNLPAGITVPIGSSSSPSAYLSWPQPQHSSVMTNTVRRMTDTDLTLFLAPKFTLHVGYAQNIQQGPSLLPARAAGILKYSALLEQYQRHSTDEYTASIDWTPIPRTLITYEQRIHRYKENSYFTLDPNGFLAQEADGTPAYLGNWDLSSNGAASTTTAFAPYSTAACNSNSIASSTTVLYPSSNGGLPIIDPSCAVVTNYTRTNPIRTTMPTEMLRFQSSSIKNLSINGQASYSWVTMNMPNYYENGQGLSGTTRDEYFSATGSGKREVYNANLGVAWQLTPTFSLSDQVTLSATSQPGSVNYPSYTKLTTTTGNETINYTGTLTSTPTTAGATQTAGVVAGTYLGATYTYFGNEQLTNSVTANWIATPKTNLSLTYRYGNKNIGLNTGYQSAYATSSSNVPTRTTFAISDQAGVFNAAYRVNANWDVNGTVEASYSDSAFTAMSPRQLRRYRVHTKFRPEKWAIFTAAYTDKEVHNNTSNTGLASVYGSLDHVDYSRTGSISGVLTPNEHIAVDFDYTYNDVYTATNICYAAQDSGFLVGTTSPYFAGAASVNASGNPQTCATSSTSSTPTQWWARSFAHAPTQYGTAGVTVSPNDKVTYGAGYRINSVAGSQFFTDARAVNGAMQSKYQTPYANVAWTVHPGLTWKAEYNYFGYSEASTSGAQYCTMASVATASSSNIVPCSSLSVSTGINAGSAGMTAPRNFHANNIALGLHYEF
ncbi:hypothetical protein ACOBR2_19860 [Telmatobacter bradus]|uniref:hypothetical protein n=1 Tax=Telmatobacter bradus TaxID=474953 RepID=UPI003B42E1BC